MRISLIILLATLFQTFANETYSQKTKLSLDFSGTKLTDVLDEIENRTEFFFLYNEKLVDTNRKVTLSAKNQNIDKVLDQLFAGTDVAYTITDRKIILAPGYLNETPQQLSVSGKVTDSKGEQLPGVTVLVKGTTSGTVTNADGNYTISNIPLNATLQFSFVGMKTQEIAVGSKTTINVTLAQEAIGLDEVVAVGYGAQKKTSLTAAVSSIKGKVLESIPVTNLSSGLGGRVSGLITRQTSGAPGDDAAKIFIRGVGTTGNAAPLLIVDGIPRDFSLLNPNSIESFSVLKDGAAVAPYGVAGANGVVLVTTKKGEQGKPMITFDSNYGVQNYTMFPRYVNSYEYATLKNAGAVNEGRAPLYSEEALKAFKDGSDPDKYPTGNPVSKIITRNAPLTTHSISISGGTEKLTYFLNAGYQNQTGMWATQKAERYNFTSNVNAKITKTTSISFNLSGMLRKSQIPCTDKPYPLRIFELIGYAWPDIPTIFSNGMIGHHAYAAIFNSGVQKNTDNLLFSTLSLEQDISFVSGLKFKGTMAYDPTFSTHKRFQLPMKLGAITSAPGVKPYVITESIFGPSKPSLTEQYTNFSQTTYQASLNYLKAFGNHNFAALALFESKANNFAYLRGRAINYPIEIDEIDMGSANSSDRAVGGSSSEARQMGFVYRASYDYASKYLIEASGRYDGSYYFANDKRWGFFPSVSLGWRMSNERFIKDNFGWIDNLKIRGSYGEVGALAGSPFQYLSMYGLGSGSPLGGQGTLGLYESSPANQNITWERAKKTDIGIDLSLFKDLLKIEADYFYEKRSNMLVSPNVTVPAEYGIGLNQVNGGIMQNQGIDLTISSNYKVNNDLYISLSGNVTVAKNKLLKVFESSDTYNNPNTRRTGRSTGAMFGLKDLGYFQVSDFDSNGNLKPGIPTQPWGPVHPGDIRYADISGPDGVPDGKIDEYNDATYMGNMSFNPEIMFGFSPSVQYKNISLNMLFQGSAKADYYGFGAYAMAFWNGMSALKDNLDYWTPENTNARNPRITTAPTTNNTRNSTFWVQDVSYLRLKSLTLSYSIPASISRKMAIQNAKVYVSGLNLLTFSKNKNIDPEVIDKGFDGSYGFGTGNQGFEYPLQKVITLGVNITL